MHICVNTYQSPFFALQQLALVSYLLQPVYEKALVYFLLVPVTFTVVPISFFNDLLVKAFFVNAISLSIPLAPNVLMKSVSNVNRTDKLKMYIFKYISDEFGVLKKLIRYILEIVGKLNYGMPFFP